jgi:aspartate--ammonia ligase
MNAIRKDEVVDHIHFHLCRPVGLGENHRKSQRNKDYLFTTVEKIYQVLLKMEKVVNLRYRGLSCKLPSQITFIDSQELEDHYPHLSSKEREYQATKNAKAVFVFRVGGKLRSGAIHDGRSPDYDDWNLNGDILLYDAVSDAVLEVSSMGIRVDAETMQNNSPNETLSSLTIPFHQAILHDRLPLTIGGGIGNRASANFFWKKKHIGEVQASYWPQDRIDLLEREKRHPIVTTSISLSLYSKVFSLYHNLIGSYQ